MAETTQLTKAEYEVAMDLSYAMSIKEIAYRRKRSIKTVEKHVQSIYCKFKVHTRLDLLRVMFCRGYIEYQTWIRYVHL